MWGEKMKNEMDGSFAGHRTMCLFMMSGGGAVSLFRFSLFSWQSLFHTTQRFLIAEKIMSNEENYFFDRLLRMLYSGE
jgi:hypothetical protein